MSADPDARGGSAALYTLGALVAAVSLAFLDRQVINLVVDAIRADVAISDTQFSLLQGAAFSLTYTFAMLPISWAADRLSRKLIIILSIVAWSAMTIAFGLAEGFVALLLARAGVAIGEAGLSPAATSIVRDSFSRERQATAMAAVTLGVYLGGAISLAGGGPALAWLTSLEATSGLPGGLAPWRILFIGAGALGLIAISLLIFIREPPRESATAESLSWRAYFGWMGEQRGAVVAYLCGYVGIYLLGAASASWMPALFMRNHGWSPSAVGVALGGIQLIAGVVGAMSGGWLVDRLGARGDTRAQLRIVRVAVLVMATGSGAAALLPNPNLALVAVFLAQLGAGACISLGAMGFQAMFPSRFSGRGVATYLLVTGVVGTAAGPTVVPLVASAFGDGANVGPALGVWSAVAGAWTLAWLSWSLGRGRPHPAPASA